MTFQCDICHRYVKGEPVIVNTGMVVGTLTVCETCDARGAEAEAEDDAPVPCYGCGSTEQVEVFYGEQSIFACAGCGLDD